jgi:hypothetical protein
MGGPSQKSPPPAHSLLRRSKVLNLSIPRWGRPHPAGCRLISAAGGSLIAACGPIPTSTSSAGSSVFAWSRPSCARPPKARPHCAAWRRIIALQQNGPHPRLRPINRPGRTADPTQRSPPDSFAPALPGQRAIPGAGTAGPAQDKSAPWRSAAARRQHFPTASQMHFSGKHQRIFDLSD